MAFADYDDDGFTDIFMANDGMQQYLSSSDKRLHFGLGGAETAKIEVAWPSGIRQTLNDVHADQFLEVREPEKP